MNTIIFVNQWARSPKPRGLLKATALPKVMVLPSTTRIPKGTGHRREISMRLRLKTSEYMSFGQYETPYDRLRGDETELKTWCVNAGRLMMRVRRELAEARQRLKAVS